MKLSLQQRIYLFTLGSCFLFGVLVASILWSTKAVNLALKRDKYAHEVEERTNVIKQFILTENIYASNYNNEHWLTLYSKYSELLSQISDLTPQQQAFQNNIESQNKNVLRLFNAINENKLKNANEVIKKHLKKRLMTQLETIRSDSLQLSRIVRNDIQRVISHEIIFILSIFSLVIFTLVYGAFRLNKIFRTSLKEVKNALEKNHIGDLQKIRLSEGTEEFKDIATAFYEMNQELSETTVSLKSVKQTVAKRTKILELIASDVSLSVILEAIVHGVEEGDSSMLCSILLLDDTGKQLLTGAAPNLPSFYNKAIHGIEIGIGVCSFGTAAFTNERVIVESIQNHSYWTSYKDLAAQAELKSCWSEPIRSTQGKVIGIFSTYHHEVGKPTNADITLIEQASRLASIAIEKTQAHLALRSSDERMQLVLAGAELGFWDWDMATNKVQRNERWATMLGYSYEEITNTTNQWTDFIHPEDRDKAWQSIADVLEGRSKLHNIEYRMLTKSGDFIWVLDQANVMQRDVNGKPIRMSGTHSDITNRKLAEEKVKLAASVFTNARESIIITDAKGTIVDINETFSRITGYSREESIGHNPRILKSGRQPTAFYDDMWKALLTEGYWTGEVWNRRKEGEVYAEMKTISAVRNEHGTTSHYVALGNDITLMKEHQEQLESIAHYDLLTHLPNRSLLSDRLSQAMLQCSRHEQSLAVVFLDLDGFKHVNDTYGHGVGDELLIALSARMKEALREGDNLARIGGDEFVAVLTDLDKIEDCELVLERLLLAASDPVTVSDVVLNVSASIGVTLYPQDNVDADMLMRHADQAMYMAKELGKNRYHLYDTAQDDAAKVQRENLAAIRSALNNHQFVLYYQPKVNMKTGTVIGVEALIRWQHPERGLLLPIEFLPSIESNPMSIEVGEWVIDAVLTQISKWQELGLNLPVTTSVNIAALQLQQPDFIDRLQALLALHPDVEPCYLELEVLEKSALDDVQHVSTIMSACMALGVNFALDDFGTGYSSLTYLRRLPAGLIKIDQSFVRDMLHDTDDLAIVEGLIVLAKTFNRNVIAEGVETIEHGTKLLDLGCELAQGYGIAKPMPAEDVLMWVNNWQPDDAWLK